MTKMEDGLPIVGPSVDFAKVPAINQKRTLAFINHFITHTVHFLNQFSGVCEEKISEMQMKIQRLEITLNMLEAKLASIPGLDQITVSDTISATASAPVQSNEPKPDPVVDQASVTNSSEQAEEGHIEAEAKDESNFLPVSKDPRYARFFKMVMVGVPAHAVKLKMSAEGLDPDMLDTPDAPAPGNNNAKKDDDDDDSSSEASSFSDSD